jgi:hypothetical protein
VANIESSNFREGGDFRWLKLSGFFEDLEMCLSADRAPENLMVDGHHLHQGKKRATGSQVLSYAESEPNL